MAHAEGERKALGRDLAQARKDAGYTLEGAAMELTSRGFPITKQTIGAWEVGRNLPDTLWLRRIARLYRTSTDVLTGNAARSVWPFTDELRAKVLTLSHDELYKLEKLMRAHLDMAHITLSEFGNSAQFDAGGAPAHQYSPAQEESSGLPDAMQVPVSQRDAQGATNRGRQRRSGGGGA